MTFGITSIKPVGLNGNSLRTTELVCFDTESEARQEAETRLQKGFQEVVVWQQIGVPKLESKVSWEGENHG